MISSDQTCKCGGGSDAVTQFNDNHQAVVILIVFDENAHLLSPANSGVNIRQS